MNNYLKDLNSLKIPKYRKLTYASLFCGGGGLDLGFALAGFKPVFSTDIEPVFCQTLRNNLPGHCVEAHDINELSGKKIRKSSGCDKIDFVIGGPPCQSFSILGDRKATNDPRGKLVFEYGRIIKELNPSGFMFENVPGIMTVNGGEDWNKLITFLKSITKMHLEFKILNSADYGVPQVRNRIVIIGMKEGYSFKWPKATHGISGNLLPFVRASYALEYMDGTPNHLLRVHSDAVIKRYSQILPGERDKKDHTDRINPNKPSRTVLVGSGGGGGRPFIHPNEHRHITVREAARLQSFPDWWVFSGGATASYRQVGNAVPPLMAKALAGRVLNAIQ